MYKLPATTDKERKLLASAFNGNKRDAMSKVKLQNLELFQRIQNFRKEYKLTFIQAIVHVLDNVEEQPVCKNTKCTNEVFWHANANAYRDYCCRECSNTDAVTKAKAVETCLKKYGVANASKSESIKQKKIDTCLKNHGVEHPSQSKNVRKKIVAAVQKKYGVDNVSKSKEVQATKVATFYERYGYSNSSKHPDVKRLIGQRVGASITRKKIVNGHGKQYILQGYEPQALKYMKRFFKYRDIHGQSSGKVPAFEYFDGRDRMYFPDFYVQSKNCIVEVKSTYTFCSTIARYRMIKAKAKAVKNAGYGFKLLVMQADGSRVKLPSDWHKLSLRAMQKYLVQQGCRL